MRILKTTKIVLLSILFILASCEGEEGPIGEQGETGTDSLIKTTSENPGVNCENGGLKIEVGLDNNSNGSLDSDEIKSTNYVCNGNNGNNSLTSVTNDPIGTNCENGGVKIDTGIDINSDGILNDNEITSTSYVCNGVNGNDSLVKTTSESAGSNCENGGLRIDSGLDANNNEVLDESEITATAYLCNGIDGNNSLTKVTTENPSSICEAGGIKIESGIDINSNSELDEEEITHREYVCNGDYDKLIRVDLNLGDFNTSSNEWQITPYESLQLFRFNKLHYTNVDSITFVSTMYTSNINNKCFNQLYNVTDNSPIENTTLESNVSDYIYVESNNIYDYLPNEEKLIGIRVRSENNGTTVAKGANSFLHIYRD